MDELARLIDHVSVGFVLRDTAGTVVAANAAAMTFFGGTGGPEADDAEPDWRAADGARLEPAALPANVMLRTGSAAEDGMVGIRRQDGAVTWLHVSARPITFTDGTPGAAETLVDVTVERANAAVADAANRELGVARRRLESVLDSIDDYIYAWRFSEDGSSEVSFESMPAVAFLRCDAGHDAETAWRNAVHPEDLETFDAAVLDSQRRGDSGEHHYRVVESNGTVRWLYERWRARRLDDGSTLGEGIVSDVSSRWAMEAEMHQVLAETQSAYAELEEARGIADILARTDALTGAANRREFHERLSLVLADETAVRGAAVVILDIDHFKSVNDTRGHQAGDAVLVEVSRRLTHGLRRDDLLARWGGEEFVICLSGIADEPTLRRRCEQLRHAICDEPFTIMAPSLALSASFGAALAAPGDTTDTLVDRADGALYEAKRGGRNQSRLAGEPESERAAA